MMREHASQLALNVVMELIRAGRIPDGGDGPIRAAETMEQYICAVHEKLTDYLQTADEPKKK
jgi:hypothetical protein